MSSKNKPTKRERTYSNSSDDNILNSLKPQPAAINKDNSGHKNKRSLIKPSSSMENEQEIPLKNKPTKRARTYSDSSDDDIFKSVKPQPTAASNEVNSGRKNIGSLIKPSSTLENEHDFPLKNKPTKRERTYSDSSDDDIFKSIPPQPTASNEDNSELGNKRSLIKQSSSKGNEQEISSENKFIKRKRQNELRKEVPALIKIIKSPEFRMGPSWCDSITKTESPDILRQNSCSDVDSPTPARDFKLVPSGRVLESIKDDITHSFGFSSPEMIILEEFVQKRIRKSVDDADIKGLLEGILPKAKDMCRSTNEDNNTADSGIYPLAPNNTPVSPIITQKEESKRKDHDISMTDASDKEETQVHLSPRQSTMIDDMASKSLPSLAQFSYVSEQLEDSFVVDKSILNSGNDTEEKTKCSFHASPHNKSTVNTKLQLSSGEDSPVPSEFLIPQQPWTPPMVESDSENENSYEVILNNVNLGDLHQTLEGNQVNTSIRASNENITTIRASNENITNSPYTEIFSLETAIPLDNAGTQGFSVQVSGDKHTTQNKCSELGSLQSNESSNMNTSDFKENLVANKEIDSSVTSAQDNTIDNNLPGVKNKTVPLLSQFLDNFDKKGTFEEASQLTPSDFKGNLVANKEIDCIVTSAQDNTIGKNLHGVKNKTVPLLSQFLDTFDKKGTFEEASQLTPTSHQNPLETPEVSQRRLFQNTIDAIGVSDLDSSPSITPTRRRMLIQHMEEIKSHITVSYNRSMYLWENMMKLLGEKGSSYS
ncbi:unnamed protein product [Meganyctiphanes norvegica]|uniref:Uncharacterized protein n=1 Tax=Meganyctiphanes norvegica TaxID=48144 RepID=A0AAV2S9J7_MEGNR